MVSSAALSLIAGVSSNTSMMRLAEALESTMVTNTIMIIISDMRICVI